LLEIQPVLNFLFKINNLSAYYDNKDQKHRPQALFFIPFIKNFLAFWR